MTLNRPFKEGDRVVCVNSAGSHYLKRGITYAVGRELHSNDMVYIKELYYSYHKHKFVFAYSYPTLRDGYLDS